MNREKKEPEYEDDGRTIADMNVEGMPWYVPQRPESPPGEKIRLTAKEQRAMTWGALKAGLLIAAVFGTVYFLFILFCTKVWFA